MLRLLRLLSTLPVSFVRSRCDLLLENLALRQQLSVSSRRHPQPRFSTPDRFFWMMLRRLWPGGKRALILVQPETVVRWHRLGSRAIGRNFLVEEYVLCQAMAQFALEVFEGLIVLPELSVELFLSVGSLFCRKFGVDVLVGSRDIELDGPDRKSTRLN